MVTSWPCLYCFLALFCCAKLIAPCTGTHISDWAHVLTSKHMQVLLQQPAFPASHSLLDSKRLAAAQQFYDAAAQQVATVSGHGVTKENQRKRAQIIAELELFFRTRLAGMGRNLHADNLFPDGTLQMTPDSVANSISALSKGHGQRQQLARGQPRQIA